MTRPYTYDTRVPMKHCPRCQTMKELAAFGHNRAEADGLAVYCRPCHAAVQRAWKDANREKVAAMRRRWNSKEPT